MIDYIKIPKDFNSLHELKSFGLMYGAAINFIKKVNEYQGSYFASFCKNLDEVLQYIPENKYSTYDVYLLDNQICRLDEFDITQIQFAEPCNMIKLVGKNLAVEHLSYRPVNTTDKMFLVDTLNKRVQICPWIFRSSTIDKKIYNHYVQITYGGHHFKIDAANNVFSAVVELRRKNIFLNQSFYFESGGGYTSGYMKYEVHDFCMRTNEYIGYNKKKSDAYYQDTQTFKY
jgi:hypothetical protein